MKRILLSVCAVLSTLTISVNGASPAPAGDGPVYSCKSHGRLTIALTFDDGPHPKYTPQILDILREYNVPATFFTVGENVEAYPELVQRCITEGHEIANHTYTHRDLSKSNASQINREITATESALWECGEIRPKLLRPPGGLYGRRVLSVAAELDYTVVLWNIDTRDWAHTPPKMIAEKVMSSVKGGDIVLMHDFIGKDSPTPDALQLIIPKLQKNGYRFVTVSELLGYR